MVALTIALIFFWVLLNGMIFGEFVSSKNKSEKQQSIEAAIVLFFTTSFTIFLWILMWIHSK